MHRERLIALERFLRVDVTRKVKDGCGTYDMYVWRCGTRACALGWAAVNPEFMLQGLRVELNGHFYLDRCLVCPMEAGMRFFDLTKDEFAYIFLGTGYKRTDDPLETCQRILDIIKDHKDEQRTTD